MKGEVIDADYTINNKPVVQKPQRVKTTSQNIVAQETRAIQNPDGTVSTRSYVAVQPNTYPLAIFLAILVVIGWVSAANVGSAAFITSFIGLPTIMILILVFASKPKWKEVR